MRETEPTPPPAPLTRPRPFQGEFLKAPRFAPAPEWPSASAKVSVEIGCGVGWHPLKRATANPSETVFALERTHERFASFARRLTRHAPLTNLHPVHADARAWITHYVPANSVDDYWLLYPNPHPKPAQASQRWHRSSFAEKLVSTLKVGGRLHFATNLEWYADEAQAYWTQMWRLELIAKQVLTSQDAPSRFIPRTHFEKKYLERGETCYSFIFARSTGTGSHASGKFPSCLI